MKPLKKRLENVAEELWVVHRQMVRGCLHHGCKIQPPTGQGTNGPCTCSTSAFARRLRDLADRLEAQ